MMTINYKFLRSRWIKPLIFIELYLTLVFFLYFFGPWDWGDSNQVLLAIYLIVAQLVIAAGYLLSWWRIKSNARSSLLDEEKCVRFLRYGLIVSCVLLIPTSLSRTGSVFPDVMNGLTNTGLAYNENQERLTAGNPYVIVEYLRMIASPLLIGVFPLAIVLWPKLNLGAKLLSLLVTLFHVATYVATGTNKGLADLVVTLPVMLYLSFSLGWLRFRVSARRGVFFFIILFIAFLKFFGASQAEREGGVGEFGLFNNGQHIIEADKSHFISEKLSTENRIIFESLTRYLGQGYAALALSFDYDTPSTYGLGGSMFLARNANVLLSTEYFTNYSIPGVLDEMEGWGMFTLWHSIYPWLASDFGYVGALIMIGLFAYLFGLSWGFAIIKLDPVWIVLLYLLSILFFYIPANNQIFQGGETVACFILLMLVIILKAVSSIYKD